jgi:hypothetical protein
MNSIDKFDDIDYLTDLLYNYLYNADKYKFEIASSNTDDIDNIKKNVSSSLINKIFNARISFSRIIKTENRIVYVFKRETKQDIYIYQYLTDSYNDITTGTNYDMIITYLLSDLVLYKKTKHILLPIMNFDIDVELISNFIDKYDELNRIKEVLNYREKKLAIKIREHFKKKKTLLEYLEENIKKFGELEYTVLLFQVLHTLAIIQEKYPTFRHNYLELDIIE